MADSSQTGPAPPTDARDPEATRTFFGGEAVTRRRPAERANPPLQPPTETVAPQPPAPVLRYGPGVPAKVPSGQADRAEEVWRAGRPPAPARRIPRMLRLLSSALTVILLAVSGVVLYLRLHHTPFHVTGVVISQRIRLACGADVTGRITTDGAAGTVSYQWLVQPFGRQQPQVRYESVPSGQHALYVTLLLPATGHGRASEKVTLQVLGPDPRTASAAMVVSC